MSRPDSILGIYWLLKRYNHHPDNITLKAAAAKIEAIIRVYPTDQHILDMCSDPENLKKWEAEAWKGQEAQNYEPYKL